MLKDDKADEKVDSTGGSNGPPNRPCRGYPLESLLTQGDVSMFVCTSCERVMREPYQNDCGHRFCMKGLEYACRDPDVSYPCLGCLAEDIEGTPLNISKAFCDRGVARNLSKQPAKCTNKGCEWQGQFSEYVEHETTCQHSSNGSTAKGGYKIDLKQILHAIPGQLWSIDHFTHRQKAAKSGMTRAVYCDPFYSSVKGYKVGACAYLNGDGMAKGRHMSVFFMIYRGNHDRDLKWPFNRKVTLTLLSQSGEEHVVAAFLPCGGAPFQKPVREKNTPTGLPMFCPLDKLADPEYGYVNDDIVKIKICVDAEELKPEDARKD